jgi:hypothetical protein
VRCEDGLRRYHRESPEVNEEAFEAVIEGVRKFGVNILALYTCVNALKTWIVAILTLPSLTVVNSNFSSASGTATFA